LKPLKAWALGVLLSLLLGACTSLGNDADVLPARGNGTPPFEYLIGFGETEIVGRAAEQCVAFDWSPIDFTIDEIRAKGEAMQSISDAEGSKFVDENVWVKQFSNLDMRRKLEGLANSLTAGWIADFESTLDNGQRPEKTFGNYTVEQVADTKKDIEKLVRETLVLSCGSKDMFLALEDVEQTAQSLLERANRYKWEPEGFTRQDDFLAWRFAEGNCAGFSLCWNIEVVSRTSCDYGVKVSGEVTHNGEPAGATWSSKRYLPALAIGIFELEAKSTNSRIGQITINCPLSKSEALDDGNFSSEQYSSQSETVTPEASPTQNTTEQEKLLFDCLRYSNGYLEGLPGSALRPWESFLLGEWYGYTGNPTVIGRYLPNYIRSMAFLDKWEQIVTAAGRQNYPDLPSVAAEFQVICLVTANVRLDIQ